MLYEINVENRRLTSNEYKDWEGPELFNYEFDAELFDLLLYYEITAIHISKTLITVATLDNEIIIFKKSQTFNKIGRTRVSLKSKDEIYIFIALDERKKTLHALSNKDEYFVYKIEYFQDGIEVMEIFREVEIINFFMNEANSMVLLILKSGRCEILTIENETGCKIRFIWTREKIIKNCRMNAIWGSNQTVLWNIGHKLHLYDYNLDKLLLDINLKNYITIDERVSMNKVLVHYSQGNIYVLVKNKIFLLKLQRRESGDYSFSFKLIYKLDDVYSAIDVSNLEIKSLNSVYTCIMTILSNSKDQINMFIFDQFFRVIRHDVIHCKKHFLRDLKRYKYLNESDYVNFEHLQSVPRFLKYEGGQLLIHKNRNQSFLKMESIGIDEIFISCMRRSLVNSSLFLINCDISREMETCIMVKYIQNNPNSVEFVDKILSKRNNLTDSMEELNLYIDLFSYFGQLGDFVRYLKDSESFLKMFTSIKYLQWHFNFVSMLYKKDITLFYYAINSLPIREIITELDWNNKIYSSLLYFMETNVDVDLKAFGREPCNHGALRSSQSQDKVNPDMDIYYYLSYFEVLSWVKVSKEKNIINCLHLLEKFPESELIQSSVINYFDLYSSVDSSSKVRKFIFENSSCVLSTDNCNIIGILIYNNIVGEYNCFFQHVKGKRKDCYIFLKNLLFYQSHYNKNPNNCQIKICLEELAELLNDNLNHIIQLYLEFSAHKFLNFIKLNYDLFSPNQLQYLTECNTSNTSEDIKYDIHSERKYEIEVKAIAMFLLNRKTDALKLLLDNELVFSSLSLVLYFNSDSESIWGQLIDMIFDMKETESNKLNDFMFWYEYLICNPTSKSSQGCYILNILSRFTFPKSQFFFNFLKRDIKDSNQQLDCCCSFHKIPFNVKYLIPEIKKLIIECVNSYKKRTENKKPVNDKIHEKYLKLQIELACTNLDYCNQETNRNIQAYIDNLPKASSINYNKDLCSLCNSKLFFIENKKLSSKVILNHCKHNYHYECYLKHVHINEKSYKFKIGIENISKNNIKCIICQYKLIINHQL